MSLYSILVYQNNATHVYKSLNHVAVTIQSEEVCLSRLQLASANRVIALTSRDGILWVQGVPNVKNR